VDEPRALTLDEARRRGQASAHLDADPTYARWLVRRVSPYVSWLVSTRTSISADGVTAASIVCGVAGGLLVALGTFAADGVAIVLLQLAYLFDVADGEVARIRGTAGLRGTYLDLIGHFVQNRALFAGAGLSLISATGGATWAIAVSFLVLGFSAPFGLYAFQHVRGGAGGAHPDHGPRDVVGRPVGGGPATWAAWLYRRSVFLLSYPASMNVFCVALAIDAIRVAGGETRPLAVPMTITVFALALSAKQIGHALRLLRPALWR
jgi:phosphatidylglycerophosphate synthase